MATPVFSRTGLVDQLVTEAVSQFLTGRIIEPFSVLAVGGYGRRELFPYSDLDLVLLVNDPDSSALKEPLNHFLRHLWDSSLKASSSVRTVAECSRLHRTNVELNVSLLDVRFIGGDAKLFANLEQRLTSFYKRKGLQILHRLAELTLSRHASFGNTVYHLEPNVKEGPGGVRDIHFLHWAALLSPQGGVFDEATEHLDECRNFLYNVRFFLHEGSGRDNNLLSFELQDEAASQLSDEKLTTEEWMRIYYRQARAVYQACLRALEFIELRDPSLLRGLLRGRSRSSTTDFDIGGNRIFLRNPAAALSSLHSLFEVFTFIGKQGIPLSWDAQRRIRDRISSLASAAPSPLGWVGWRRFLAQPHTALALHEMEAAGVLLLVLPEWGTIESLVVRDFYHRYTVDEHTILAIEAIDNLVANEGEPPPRFRELALEEENLVLVRMALLLHDIGKGTKPGDHVSGSIQAATALLNQINTPEADKQTVLYLIAHHLDLSLVMNARDLDDPATGRLLSSTIGTIEDLRKLTLLTYADVSAVNPTAMTPWRAEQLWRVYSVALAQFTRELASERIHHDPQSILAASNRRGLAKFLEGFPTRYLRVHTPQQVETHFELAQRAMAEGVALDIDVESGAYTMTVVAQDHSGLFASLCGTLAGFGMNILKAEAASNASGCVLDEFRFSDPTRTLELNPDELQRLRSTVSSVVRGTIDVCDVLKRRRAISRPRTALPIPQSVRFDNEASESSTPIDFVGEDRPGLLFDLSSRLTEAGCNIEVVLVNTEAHRALDVFYVTRNGGKINLSMQAQLRASLTPGADGNI